VCYVSCVNLRLLAAAWLLSLLALGFGSARICDALASRIGTSLAAFLPAFVKHEAEAKPSNDPGAPAVHEPTLARESRSELVEEKSEAPQGARQKSRRKQVAKANAPAPSRHGIRVSAESVVRLANSGARPRGTPVRATPERPAGLELHGVGALGIGLRDGDVLTDAGGRPARSEAEVVGMILASRGAQVPEISGRFYRDGEAWNLIVEQPYLTRSRGIAVGSEVHPRAMPSRQRKVAALR
jgi:hypothetical protein